MPVTIYPTNLKYKNQNGQFQSATAIKGDSGKAIVEQISGTTPTIVCEDNHRYICGEVLSLTITPPANGACEIIFESGSTATLLVVPNTMKWPEWFNPNALEANATYQFKLSNGLANVAIWPDEGLTGDTRVRIQKMLGIYESPWELIREDTVTNATEADIDITVDGNGEAFELTDVLMVLIVPTHSEDTTIGDYGRIYMYNNTTEIRRLYLLTAASKLVQANSTPQIAIGRLLNNNGLMSIDFYQWSAQSNRANLQIVPNSDSNGISTPFAINTSCISKVKIGKIAGKLQYRLYGKRKWQ